MTASTSNGKAAVVPAPAQDSSIPCPTSHVMLLLLATAPAVVSVPVNLNIVGTAALAVYVGCRRSVKPEPPAESMTKKDAMKFPIIGSVVLCSLFLLFKFLPKDLVNAVLTAYFVLLGTFAVTATMLPFVAKLFPAGLRKRILVDWKNVKIPFIMPDPEDIIITLPELVAGLLSLGFCVWYYSKKHWLANNVLGLAFSIQGIEHLSLGAISTGVILLSGLFFYDIFWVFCTPVMVTVAKSFDAPIKLLFPRDDSPEAKSPFSMLGLGDIVIPGIFVALLLRYDVKHGGRSKYFYSAFVGYVVGLGTTIAVMNIFSAAQPALLYIVPAVLGAVGLHALARGEFNKVFHYTESVKDLEEAEEKRKKVESDAAESAAKAGSKIVNPAPKETKKTS